MSFHFKPAVRDHIPLLIGIAGGTGSGKTLTALLIARGICGGDDSGIFFLDTEGERGKQYAPPPGHAPRFEPPFTFGMRRAEMAAPFHPDRYAEAALAAADQGAKVLVIDSMSHEYFGEGGISDMHLAELERMARNKQGEIEHWRMEALTAPAWKAPKRAHKAMMQRLIQRRCHLIFCLRAEPKIKFVKVQDERTGREKNTIVDAGWQPICEKMFMFEMTCSFLMDQERPGCIARPMKINEEHKPFFPLDAHIGHRTGELLVAWSRGAVPTTIGRTDAPAQQQGVPAGSSGSRAEEPPPAGGKAEQDSPMISAPVPAAAPTDKPDDYWILIADYEKRIDNGATDGNLDVIRQEVIDDATLFPPDKDKLRARIQGRRRKLAQQKAA